MGLSACLWLKHEEWLELLEDARANSWHLKQILQAGKSAVCCAPGQNGICLCFPDAGQGYQLLPRSGVEIEFECWEFPYRF